MEWVKSKTTMIFGICLAVMGLQGYATMSMRKTMEERLTSLEDEYAAADERITMLSSDLGVVTKRTGVTAQELQQAQGMAIQLKRDNARLSHRLRTGVLATIGRLHWITECHVTRALRSRRGARHDRQHDGGRSAAGVIDRLVGDTDVLLRFFRHRFP